MNDMSTQSEHEECIECEHKLTKYPACGHDLKRIKMTEKEVCEIALKVINACESVSRIGSLEIKDDLTSAGKHAGMLLKDIMKTARDQISEKSKKPAS